MVYDKMHGQLLSSSSVFVMERLKNNKGTHGINVHLQYQKENTHGQKLALRGTWASSRILPSFFFVFSKIMILTVQFHGIWWVIWYMHTAHNDQIKAVNISISLNTENLSAYRVLIACVYGEQCTRQYTDRRHDSHVEVGSLSPPCPCVASGAIYLFMKCAWFAGKWVAPTLQALKLSVSVYLCAGTHGPPQSLWIMSLHSEGISYKHEHAKGMSSVGLSVQNPQILSSSFPIKDNTLECLKIYFAFNTD